MSAIWLIVGLFVGAGVTALVMRERIRALRENQVQMRDNQAQMSDSFKALSAEALDASVGQLAELAKTQLQSSQTEARGELEKRAARGGAVGQAIERSVAAGRSAAADTEPGASRVAGDAG